MNIITYYSVNNDCYKNNVNKVDSRYSSFQRNGPKGLMLHSVGCSQPNAKVFADKWNKAGKSVAVHAVLQADGTVYKCLPWNYRGWHAGGNANNTHVGVEMTEPDCIKYKSGSSFTCSDLEEAKAQVRGTYATAVELFAMLCNRYGLDPMRDIISHREGHAKGIASNHGDPEHIWKQLGTGYTMDTFREAVKTAMSGAAVEEEREPEETKSDGTPFIVRVKIKDLNIRKGPGYKLYASVGYIPVGSYTIVEVKKGDGYTWGRLKSGAGWIALEHTERV